MKSILEEGEPDLSNLLCIRDKEGPAVMIGLLATVFFEQPWTRAVREAVTDVAEDYLQQFRLRLRWTKQNNTGRVYSIDAGRVPFPKEWLPAYEDGESWEFGFHGGESEEAVSDFHLSALGDDDVSKGLGHLQIYLPLLWFADHPGTFPEFVLKICERIKPLSGYGGVGVLQPLHLRGKDRVEPLVTPLAERFPGLEVENPIGHGIYLDKGIKGVNWLTILGERWIEAAGGLDYLRARLDESFVFHRYSGGLMIQAGPKPQIGDVQANRWPQRYVTLAKVLKKIQITNHRPFHLGGPGRMDHEASLKWLFRFDGK